MYRARSLASALVATLVTAAAVAGVAWLGATLAARGTSQAILPTLLTTNNFAALEWPYRTDQPPAAVHVAFYVALAAIALIAGLVTLLAARKASPRNGLAALLGTWFGVILGSLVAAVAVYFIRVDALAPTLAARNGVLAELVRSFTFGGLLLGLVPAVLSWATFKIANRSRAAQYAVAMVATEDGVVDENPFDLAPGSNGEARPVEPGFTYPAGDVADPNSYANADLPPSERRTPSRTFSDVTDVLGDDFVDRDPAAQAHQPEVGVEPVDLSFSAPEPHAEHADPEAEPDATQEATAVVDAPEAPADAPVPATVEETAPVTAIVETPTETDQGVDDEPELRQTGT